MRRRLILPIFLALVASVLVTAPALGGEPNGKGKGLSTAPGQADNFSRGLTTAVTTTAVVTTGESVNVTVATGEPSVLQDVRVEATTDETVADTWTEYHPSKAWKRTATKTVTTTTITTTTTVNTTIPIITTTVVTPWTITETTVVTVVRHGSPRGNGAVVSSDTLTTSETTYGVPDTSESVAYDVSVSVASRSESTDSPPEVTRTDWEPI